MIDAKLADMGKFSPRVKKDKPTYHDIQIDKQMLDAKSTERSEEELYTKLIHIGTKAQKLAQIHTLDDEIRIMERAMQKTKQKRKIHSRLNDFKTKKELLRDLENRKQSKLECLINNNDQNESGVSQSMLSWGKKLL